ncbi:MAG TPA: type II secretion system F family protein [Candidatus Nitrosotenuis sp.]|jgi:type IV pilus assembly protein PilC|nr:type II secretion system F family protein [Candidatus Nitrosotenuis sp.]
MSLEPPSLPPQPGPPSLRGLVFGLGLQKRALFFRQMASLMEAGVSLGKAVRTAGPHSLGGLTETVAREVDAGIRLSQALGRYPHLFTPYEINMVAAGETGGALDRRLGDLAASLEQNFSLQQMLLSRLLYPMLVLHAAIFIPTLPILVLQGPAPYLLSVGMVLVPAYGLVLGSWLLYRLASASSGIRLAIDQFLLMVPILGRALRTLAGARFLAGLGQLYEAGLPAARAVELAASACGNSALAARLAGTAARVQEGLPLTQALAPTGLLPPMAMQMMSAGEESGSISTILQKTARYMHQEVEHTTQRVMTVLPVVLLLIVGFIVGVVALRALAPVLSIYREVIP